MVMNCWLGGWQRGGWRQGMVVVVVVVVVTTTTTTYYYYYYYYYYYSLTHSVEVLEGVKKREMSSLSVFDDASHASPSEAMRSARWTLASPSGHRFDTGATRPEANVTMASRSPHV